MKRSVYKTFLLTTALMVAFGSAVLACGAGDYSGKTDKGEDSTKVESD